MGEPLHQTTMKPRGFKAKIYWIACRVVTLLRLYHETQRVRGQDLLSRFARGLCLGYLQSAQVLVSHAYINIVYTIASMHRYKQHHSLQTHALRNNHIPTDTTTADTSQYKYQLHNYNQSPTIQQSPIHKYINGHQIHNHHSFNYTNSPKYIK